MLEIHGLTVRFGDTTAVDALDLHVERGTLFGLLGPNGAGKTTTISCIAGLLSPTAGTIRVGGIDVASHPDEVRRILGLVPQSLALYGALTVSQNLRVLVAQAAFVGGFALLLAGLGRTEKQIASIGTAVVLVMSFIDGAWFPSFLMPEAIQTVGALLPVRGATEGLAAMTWRGLGFADALPAIAVLSAFTAVCVAVGVRRFRWDAA